MHDFATVLEWRIQQTECFDASGIQMILEFGFMLQTIDKYVEREENSHYTNISFIDRNIEMEFSNHARNTHIRLHMVNAYIP